MRFIKALLSVALTAAILYILQFGVGSLPALGTLMNPFTGFWANSELGFMSENGHSKMLNLKGTKGTVIIKYDENRVPHIFAENDYDLYFAQGYATAADRLWQMEFQTHFAAGRISEIVGEKGLESDRYQRRMGSVYGAEKSLEGMMERPENKTALEGYAAGVNAYIAQLSESKLPFEYKLLGYKPEVWTPIKSALFLKNMSFVLASGSDELMMSNALKKFGSEVMDNLFPNYPTLESPIIPDGTPLDFKPLALPAAPPEFKGAIAKKVPAEQDKSIGSNNWAVGGAKSATGLPILANDPHLQLNLPSIWYQAQLCAPGVNVYGSTMPGTPNVIIGFNKNIAWGVTNVGADIIDWYEVKFKDASKEEYWHNNSWKKVSKRIETIKVKGKPTVVDTVLYTHHGPVVYLSPSTFKNNIPTGHALRWIAHDKSQELSTFYKLNRANNYNDYVEALSYFSAPAQNFIFASNQNDIALWVNGRFPLKSPQQGKYLLDGTSAQADWAGFIPALHNPHVKNPPRGFVSSANQSSVNPKEYPYYINWAFAETERGRRINQRLEKMTAATVDSLRLLQNDNFNLRAHDVLPKLLELVQNPSPKIAPAVQMLKKWNLQNDVGEVGATIFEEWMAALFRAIWHDEFGENPDKMPMKMPSADRTIQLLLHEPNARWIDNVATTNKVETLPELAHSSLAAAIDSISAHKGAMGPSWAWNDWKSTSIKHLLGGTNSTFDKFSRINVKIGGGKSIVNASSQRNGPSWRMIVQLDAQGKPKAYGVYPGGQSGNPGSTYYDNMVDTWANGKLNELLYLGSAKEPSSRIQKVLVINKK